MPNAVFILIAFLILIPRAAVAETHPGIRTQTLPLVVRDGTRLQAIVTRPATATGRLPAILYVQPLSCDSVTIPDTGGDGWASMLRRIVRESGALVWRTEKRGIGGSEGTCATLDYDTELADHRDALAALRARADIDPARIVVFGGSMGGTYAPLVAQDQDIAGVMIWGAGARTWAERMLSFERNAIELSGTAPATRAAEVAARYRYFDEYLLKRHTPQAIADADPELGKTWSRIVGTSAGSHYGRPFAFHQQAQAQNWVEAWRRVRAPVLALHGEFDWFEDFDSVRLIGDTVNTISPGRATVIDIPGLDHHFTRFKSRADAFKEVGGEVDADRAVDIMLPWLRARLGLSAPR